MLLTDCLCSFIDTVKGCSGRIAGDVATVGDVHWGGRRRLTIPEVIEISDRQADNETGRGREREDGSVGTLVKQDKDSAVLAWLFTPERNQHGSSSCIFRCPFYAVFWLLTLQAMNDKSFRVKVANHLQCHSDVWWWGKGAWNHRKAMMMAQWSFNLFSHSSISLQYTATERIHLQCCVLLWLCGC